MIAFQLFCIALLFGYSAAFENMSRSYTEFKCSLTSECQELLGVKSTCVEDNCQCVPHYHINNERTCIKDRGLKEICDHSDQCYWGPEMVDKIECMLGVCSCVHGYVPHHGKICVKYFSKSGSTMISVSFILLLANGFVIFLN